MADVPVAFTSNVLSLRCAVRAHLRKPQQLTKVGCVLHISLDNYTHQQKQTMNNITKRPLRKLSKHCMWRLSSYVRAWKDRKFSATNLKSVCQHFDHRRIDWLLHPLSGCLHSGAIWSQVCNEEPLPIYMYAGDRGEAIEGLLLCLSNKAGLLKRQCTKFRHSKW